MILFQFLGKNENKILDFFPSTPLQAGEFVAILREKIAENKTLKVRPLVFIFNPNPPTNHQKVTFLSKTRLELCL